MTVKHLQTKLLCRFNKLKWAPMELTDELVHFMFTLTFYKQITSK